MMRMMWLCWGDNTCNNILKARLARHALGHACQATNLNTVLIDDLVLK